MASTIGADVVHAHHPRAGQARRQRRDAEAVARLATSPSGEMCPGVPSARCRAGAHTQVGKSVEVLQDFQVMLRSVLPKPMPGSTAIRDRAMPRDSHQAMRRARKSSAPRSTTSSYRGLTCMVWVCRACA